ncbi:hypothetical protein INS49_006880 [Diaporthe citri]|uniref:uncharacterized protein n=1 Tax=Diaporthe citri TaxID=83186 RepID=UPI001C81E290|nr:uncharacterized protein INS49_006880 [Diaporthe citri]KAG6365271.1 hypothetical protein INS49_006880 [Diaporthe citri]
MLHGWSTANGVLRRSKGPLARMSTTRLAQPQEQEQRRKARNGPPSAPESRFLWFPRAHQQRGGGESLVPSGRRDQVTATRAAAVPQDLGNGYQYRRVDVKKLDWSNPTVWVGERSDNGPTA